MQRAAEPDECYVFGRVEAPDRPDLKGTITPYRLRGDRYEETPESEVLAGVDLRQLAEFLDRPTTSQSIVEYRAALEARRTRGV